MSERFDVLTLEHEEEIDKTIDKRLEAIKNYRLRIQRVSPPITSQEETRKFAKHFAKQIIENGYTKAEVRKVVEERLDTLERSNIEFQMTFNDLKERISCDMQNENRELLADISKSMVWDRSTIISIRSFVYALDVLSSDRHKWLTEGF